MAKEKWKAGNMIYPLPAVLVTCRSKSGEDNVFTVAWTGTVCTNPPMAYISVRPSRYSYNMIKETGEFVINLTTEEMAKATDYCGVTSGRDVDKFQRCGLHKEEADEVNVPMLVESPVNIECRVREAHEYGSHTMFVADVICVHADEKYMNESGRFELEKSNPLAYSHGTYFGLTSPKGTFGYSVKKGKKKK
ncbi:MULTISPECIES: flavin reductase family protein [Pseudobutyrivibrio]|jgi:flavin reductase (DIM6/NTAB) family NADH-FMN oxidoreductase RutF|uniref:Flavin reductase family protein n=2 Tax=Pseudobutyrivibrio TaxID=46205 RepID=A0A2G3DYI3_9FIRM|nr:MULTISPECIES: flavin reductase family protein [Pseudobutyrivibrio]MBE5904116.1 flavin reductase family protein [Pseudobutyrivibrio sp.]MBR5953087.1 flavin reductase family protein [Pseudobutyrivibrio sp.]NEX00571.1 flavin reductase family protein [Pseudobutyrivibrio xylanivorans]PHU36049.1 flavin reductase family protein [Pseudobutyrivibrio ruminis]SCX98364.1 NADH-FMN oxidoreductase RutF, flavin reductase (DIM6/NTAB) family [Pseudobutyrivibrio sp. AR14]